MVNSGDVYLWVNNVPKAQMRSKRRYIKILHITDTHVFVRHFYGGFHQPWNILIDKFKAEYTLVRKSCDSDIPLEVSI